MQGPASGRASSPTSTTGRDRAQREAELRQIAAQRRGKAADVAATGEQPPERPSSAPTGDQHPVANSPALCDSGALSVPPSSAGASRALVVDQDNTQQLAIYINGKIRSNSIFCRSTSSTSFSSILNRFHPNSATQSGPSRSSVSEGKGEQGQEAEHARGRKSLTGRAKSAAKGGYRGLKCKESTLARLRNWLKLRRPAEVGFSIKNNCPLLGPKRDSAADAAELESSSSSPSLGALSGSGSNTPTSGLAGSPTSGHRKLAAGRQPVAEQGKKLSAEAEREQAGDKCANKTSYKLNPSSMFLKKAMRYYRLWIYCTNITILLGTLIFILSSVYVLSDFRIKLLFHTTSHQQQRVESRLPAELEAGEIGHLNGNTTRYQEQHLQRSRTGEQDDANGRGNESASEPVIVNYQHSIENGADPDNIQAEPAGSSFNIRYTEPCVLLACAAIAVQAGLLQAIGCFGALRMKERWIQTFWYLIVALTVFDVVIVMYWLGRFSHLKQALEGHMKFRLREHYGHPAMSPPDNQSSSLSPSFGRLSIEPSFDKILTVSCRIQ